MKVHNTIVDAALATSSIAALSLIKSLHDIFALLGAIVMFGVAIARLLLLLHELRERKRNAQSAEKPPAPPLGNGQAD
jgi:hypothetical protein